MTAIPGYISSMNGNELKAQIVREGLTQRRVADAMNIRHESLSRILRGDVSEKDAERVRKAIAKSKRDDPERDTERILATQ
jgi:transcriptional regulator with XRE-family HTH domain